MKSGKSGEDGGVSAGMLKSLLPSGIGEMTKIISSIWIDDRTPNLWNHTIITPLNKKLSVWNSAITEECHCCVQCTKFGAVHPGSTSPTSRRNHP
ncbi:hypothetical protein RB195_022507 [Necator americanus]|uniref:Uncharacterized protein n=1 Tax=Necator americanus TaxID=51031 RepID=A0ABR1EFI9_NECAM